MTSRCSDRPRSFPRTGWLALLLPALTTVPTASTAATAATTGSAAEVAGSCTATWQDTHVPDSYQSDIDAMSGTSPTDLYAVGTYYAVGTSDSGQAIQARRNTGTGWTRLSLLTLPLGSALTDVSSASPGDAWFGGYASRTVQEPVLFHALGWSVTQVALPAPPNGFDSMSHEPGLLVDATGDGGLWAAASYYPTTFGGDLRGVLYRRTAGGAWVSTEIPGVIESIDAMTATRGYIGGAGGLYRIADGAVTKVQLPGDPTSIEGITSRSASDVWVLARSASDSWMSLLHYDGTRWTPVSIGDPSVVPSVGTISVAPNGVLWLLGHTLDYRIITGRYTPSTARWAFVESNINDRSPEDPDYYHGGVLEDLLTLSGGNIYVGGTSSGQFAFVGRLCQLTAGARVLTPSSVAVSRLGNEILVTGGNAVTNPVTVTDRTGAVSTGPLGPEQGGTLRFFAAGTYQVVAQQTGSSSTVSVPIRVTQSFIHNSLTVFIATRPAPPGFHYRLQVQRPGSTSWEDTWLDARFDGRSRTFYYDKWPAGTYSARAKLRGPTTGTDWSPVAQFTVPCWC